MMSIRHWLFTAAIAAVAAGAGAFAATEIPPLRGDRFAPLQPQDMTEEQRVMVEHLLSGPRGSLNGPFNVMLRSPDLGDRLQRVGEFVRFKTSIPPRLNELAILVTARHWTAQYEWYAHYDLALKAGVSPEIADAIAAGKRPAALDADEAVVFDFVEALLEKGQVSDDGFAAAKEKFGERGVVDLIGLVGYYCTVSMVLNTDRYPLPDGAAPPLAPLN